MSDNNQPAPTAQQIEYCTNGVHDWKYGPGGEHRECKCCGAQADFISGHGWTKINPEWLKLGPEHNMHNVS